MLSVAQKFGVSPQEILDANKDKKLEDIKIGHVLIIPQKRIYTQTPPPRKAYMGHEPKKTDIKKPEPPKVSKPSNMVKTLTVQLGDSTQKYKRSLPYPIRTNRMSSNYGPRWGSFHEGVDFPAKINTPVYATHDGVVFFSTDQIRGYGNLVAIRSEDGLMTVYAHNNSLQVRKGQFVKQGDLIAYSGNTGRSTGPHVHFETRIRVGHKWYATDPRFFLQWFWR